MLFFQMELAKCSDRYFSGRPVYLAKVLGSSVEELVTTTVFVGVPGELLVEVNLCLGVLGHRFDDQVSVGHGLGKIELQLECGVGTLDGGERRFLVEGLGAIGDTGAPLARTVRHALDCRDVLLAHVIDLGLGAADAALAAQPNRYIKAAVGSLKGNLASQCRRRQHKRSCSSWNGPLLRNSIDVYLFNRKDDARWGWVL